VPDVTARSACKSHLDSEADSGAGRCHGRETFVRETVLAKVPQQAAAHGRDLETPRPKFVVDVDENSENSRADDAQQDALSVREDLAGKRAEAAFHQSKLLTEPLDTAWREEVTARLHRYQARRRPRAPRYPSLRLKFEAPATRTAFPEKTTETLSASAAESSFVPLSPNRESVAIDCVETRPDPLPGVPAPETAQNPAPQPVRLRPELTGKIIEFPRPAVYEPPVITDGLAEPIFDRPRILEAPEVVPPPPALGGILIEEISKPEPERRLGIDMPLHPAPIEQRLAAMLVDCVLIALGVTVFGTIYYQLTKLQPPISQLLEFGSGLLALFWAAYQYLLVVYSGTTPGLRAMKLQLLRFDGSPAKRSLRRWRVICSWLSAMSLGMGYFWQFLDEDGLCWHERVTRTYLASTRTQPLRS
jgi:uncharacterized RDD family membrane protein YckC